MSFLSYRTGKTKEQTKKKKRSKRIPLFGLSDDEDSGYSVDTSDIEPLVELLNEVAIGKSNQQHVRVENNETTRDFDKEKQIKSLVGNPTSWPSILYAKKS